MPKKPFNPSLVNIAFALGVAIFFLADRFLKTLALNMGEIGRPLIANVLNFHFSANYHIAFSLPLSGWWLSTVIGIVIVILAAYSVHLASRPETTQTVFALALIVAGALSNLSDRLSYGFVVDYLELRYFTVFNLADVMITAGALWLIIKSLRTK